MNGDAREASATPLKNGYLVRNPLLNAWLRLSDAALVLARGRATPAEPSAPPSSVLVSVGGHRGDAIVATVFLESLRRTLPGVRIGVLTGAWNEPAFANDKRLHALHLAHHWRLDRAPGSAWQRWRRSRQTQRHALRGIRAQKYDVAVELSPHYPSAAGLFHRAGIPRRVGYPTGGGSPLLTQVVPWTTGRSMVDEHLTLLDAVVAPAKAQRAPGGYHLFVAPAASGTRALELLRQRGVAPGSYVMIHAGAGAEQKVWPVERWRDVARVLAAEGTSVVLSGFGAAEAALNRRIAEGTSGVVDLTDNLDWDGMRATIANARLVLCADTVAMHLAAADATPAIAIMTGIWPLDRWRPPVESTRVLSHAVPCAPCYVGRGCDHMSCVRGITTEEVLAAARAQLSAPSGAAVPARL